MSLALSAYKVRTSSTGGIQKFISTGPTPTTTSTLSSVAAWGFCINTESSARIGEEATSIWSDSQLVAYFSGASATNPGLTVIGAVAGTEGFQTGDQPGVTNTPAADTLTKITISGGIITAYEDVSIASIIGGASSNYWLTGSNVSNNFQWIRPIAQATNLHLLICGSITSTKSSWVYGDLAIANEGSITAANPSDDRFSYRLFVDGTTKITGTVSADSDLYLTLGGSYATTKFGSDGIHYFSDAFGTKKIDIDANADSSNDMFSVTGNIYCQGNLYVDGNKNFKISHPDPFKKKDYWLVHSALEGPEAAIYFRKQFILDQSSTTINLPYYWEWLVDESSIQVFCDSSEYIDREISLTSIKLNIKKDLPIYNVPISMMVFAERKENKIVVEEHK